MQRLYNLVGFHQDAAVGAHGQGGTDGLLTLLHTD